MKTKTFIIGKRSNLSQAIKHKIKDSHLITLSQINYFKTKKILKKNKIKLIINQFYPSSKLNNIESFEKFYESSILSLAKLLDS